jgi:hypothetical protein
MYQAQKKNYEADLKAKKISQAKANNNLAGLTHRFKCADRGGRAWNPRPPCSCAYVYSTNLRDCAPRRRPSLPAPPYASLSCPLASLMPDP